MGTHDRTPVVYVAIEGRTAPADLTRRVLSLEVDEHVGKSTHLSLTLLDPDGKVRNGDLVREGLTLGVRFGYIGQLGPARAGIVHRIGPAYNDDTTKIEAYGKELAFARGPVRRAFRGRTLRAAIEQIAQEAGAKVRWDAPAGVTFEGQVLVDTHPWTWILEQTAALGLEVAYEGDTLTIREPAFGRQPAAVLHYNWRNAELLSFEPDINVKKKEKEAAGVVALFFDPATGQTLSHAAGDPNTTRATLAARRVAAAAQGQATAREQRESAATEAAKQKAAQEQAQRAGAVVQDVKEGKLGEAVSDAGSAIGVNSVDDLISLTDLNTGQDAGTTGTGHTVATPTPADVASARQHVRQIAEGKWKNAERQRAKARCTAIGAPSLRKGTVVQVVGVSPRDAGLWYVRGCTHKIDEGYETELELTRDGVNGPRGDKSSGTKNTTTGSANGSGTGNPPDERVPVNIGDV